VRPEDRFKAATVASTDDFRRRNGAAQHARVEGGAVRMVTSPEKERRRMSSLSVTLLSVMMGFVVGGVFLAAAGYDPFRAFR
jgi:hypothetical protein